MISVGKLCSRVVRNVFNAVVVREVAHHLTKGKSLSERLLLCGEEG